MKRKLYFFAFLCAFASLWLLFAACGPDFSLADSLVAHQPRVVEVDPADGRIVSAITSVKVIFSIPIDPTSIDEKSFAVLAVQSEMPDLDDLAADVSKGDVPSAQGTYELNKDFTEVTFTPSDSFQAGAKYCIVITNGVRTTAAIPLNQNPGGPPAAFMSTFSVAGGAAEGGVADTYDESDPEGGGQTEPPPVRPAKLVINEILYDASGDETDGSLFVELAGDADSEISGYKIIFINGADGAETETIEIPENSIIRDDGIFLIADSRTGSSGETRVPGADLLDNFDPQNGPDCVQLTDDHGALLDAFGYGTPLPQNAQNGLECFESQAGPDAAAGKSVSRTDGTDTDNNAEDFKIFDNPTPGFL